MNHCYLDRLYAENGEIEGSVNCWHQDPTLWTILSAVYGAGIHYIERQIRDFEEATDIYSSDNERIEGIVKSLMGDIVLLKGKNSFDETETDNTPAVFHKGAKEDRFSFVVG